MSPQEFDRLMTERMEKCKLTLMYKAREYAPGMDRFHNFNRAAAILKTSPEKALVAFMTKHLVSVLDLLEQRDDFYEWKFSYATWDEKIGDLISYLILLDAMVSGEFTKEES